MSTFQALQDRWRTPFWQNALTGMVLFCGPGMFDAITAMGAGGQAASLTSLVAKANSALYACFAIVGFFGGSVNNTIGPRWTLFIGTIGYAVYVGSLWSLDRGGPQAFVVAAGAILGVTAALLWTAQGFVVLSYPKESEKSRYFAIQWSLLGVGAAIGGLIPLGQILNSRSGTADAVSTGAYIGFFIVMCAGIVASLFLSDPTKVYRPDGTPITIAKPADFRTEIMGVCKLIFDWKIMLLGPACLASNWFYAYQFGMNAFYFSLRARSLNSVMYWFTQVIGTFFIAALLDLRYFDRRTRGLIGLTVVSVFILTTWAGGAVFQSTFTRKSILNGKDWTDEGWAGPFVLYCFYGISDAMFQSYCYWLMGAITNDPWRLARYAGFYKGVQSAGAAISFGLNAAEIPFNWELGICFVLIGISLIPMYVVACTIIETNYGKEEGVPPPLDVPVAKDGKEDMEKDADFVAIAGMDAVSPVLDGGDKKGSAAAVGRVESAGE